MIKCYVEEEFVGELPLDFSEITAELIKFPVPRVIEPFDYTEGGSLVNDDTADVVVAQVGWCYNEALHFDSIRDYEKVKYIYRARRPNNAN